jgi:hypothetical protein
MFIINTEYGHFILKIPVSKPLEISNYDEPVAKPAFLHKSDDFGASPRSAQIGISDWA